MHPLLSPHPVPLSIANTLCDKQEKIIAELLMKQKLTLIAKQISLSSTAHSFIDLFCADEQEVL